MRGLGDSQRAQMKRADPRIGQLFAHLRQGLDLLEDILTHPYAPPPAEQPKPTPAAPRPVTDPERRAYRVKEVCKLVGISHTTIWRAMREGKLRHVRIGRRILILAADLQAWLDSLPAG